MDAYKEHEKYMALALNEAKEALAAGEFPVGCVIVDDNGIICTGKRDKSIDHNEMEHAEIMALRSLLKNHRDRMMNSLRIYCTMEPCLMCFSTLILNNVKNIIYGFEDVMGGGTSLELERLSPLYREMKIDIVPGVLRKQCLMLFKEFFQDRKTDYLKGTLLARYTLNQ